MSDDQGAFETQGGKTADVAKPGRPSRHIGRRRLLAGGLAVAPLSVTLGTPSASANNIGNTLPRSNACHSNSLSRLASLHPGTRDCQTR